MNSTGKQPDLIWGDKFCFLSRSEQKESLKEAMKLFSNDGQVEFCKEVYVNYDDLIKAIKIRCKYLGFDFAPPL